MPLDSQIGYYEDNMVLPSCANITFGCFPKLRFALKNVVLPGITMNTVEADSHISKIVMPGKGVQRNVFTFEVYCDAGMDYWEIFYDWILSISLAQSGQSLRDFLSADTAKFYEQQNMVGGSTRASMILLNGKKNPIKYFTFGHMFPTSITDIKYSYTETSSDPLTFSVSMAYNTIQINKADEAADTIFQDPRVKSWLQSARKAAMLSPQMPSIATTDVSSQNSSLGQAQTQAGTSSSSTTGSGQPTIGTGGNSFTA